MTLENFVGYENEFEGAERGVVKVFRGGKERVEEEVEA